MMDFVELEGGESWELPVDIGAWQAEDDRFSPEVHGTLAYGYFQNPPISDIVFLALTR